MWSPLETSLNHLRQIQLTEKAARAERVPARLRQLRLLRSSLTEESAKTLVHPSVSTTATACCTVAVTTCCRSYRSSRMRLHSQEVPSHSHHSGTTRAPLTASPSVDVSSWRLHVYGHRRDERIRRSAWTVWRQRIWLRTAYSSRLWPADVRNLRSLTSGNSSSDERERSRRQELCSFPCSCLELSTDWSPSVTSKLNCCYVCQRPNTYRLAFSPGLTALAYFLDLLFFLLTVLPFASSCWPAFCHAVINEYWLNASIYFCDI